MNANVASLSLLSRASNETRRPCQAPDFSFSSQVHCRYELADSTLWTKWSPQDVPCFNPQLLRDLERASQSIESFFSGRHEDRPLHYIVVGSSRKNVFNLGGDLSYFHRLITSQDRAGLTEYARAATNVIYQNYVAHNLAGVTTIAMLQGDALGGGFECALSCDVIVAEKHVKAGFPEILFDMFPGMGGMSFLARRMGRAKADQIVRDGKLYTAPELRDMGLVDLVVESGEGPSAVAELTRVRQNRISAHTAINRADRIIRPVSQQELREVVRLWVDCAMNLSTKGRDWMRRLAERQKQVFSQPDRADEHARGSSISAAA